MKPFVGVALIALVACASCGYGSSVVSHWQSPSATQRYFRKVLVIAPLPDPAQRREAERALAKRVPMNGVKPPVPEVMLSSDVIPLDELGNAEAVRARAAQLGVDGVVVFRIVRPDQTSWVPGATAGPSYAFGGWPVASPTHVDLHSVVRSQIYVYALPSDQLIWAGMLTTYNPGSISWLVGDASRRAAIQMRHDHAPILHE